MTPPSQRPRRSVPGILPVILGLVALVALLIGLAAVLSHTFTPTIAVAP